MTDDAHEAFPATPRTLWGQQVFAEALLLRGRIELLSPTDAERHPRDLQVAADSLRLVDLSVRLALAPPPRSPRRRLHEWWTGSRVESCWAYLRAAEVRLAEMADPTVRAATVNSALAHSHRLPENDIARAALAKQAVSA